MQFPSHLPARFLLVSLLFSGIVGCSASPQPDSIAVGPVASAPKAPPLPAVEPFPIPVVEIYGTPEDLGEQHATRLKGAIRLLHEKYLMVYIAGTMQRVFALGAAQGFENQLRPEHRAEVASLARYAEIDERETMLGQCFLDLTDMAGCSTITLPAAASPDHVARFGRNLDFRSLDIADKYSTLFIVRPNDGRYAFATVGWPGMIGVLSGMNEHGLCLANMEVPRSFRLPAAMPYTMLYRTILERCRNVDEAVKLLEATPRQTANNLMLMDADGIRAVVEIRPESVHVRWGDDSTSLISTNHQRDQDTDTPGLCWRYDYLHETSETDFGKIGVDQIHDMLAQVGNQSTMQSMIFEPSTRTIYLSTGTSAAIKRMYVKQLFPVP